jgi:glutathione S-transferase
MTTTPARTLYWLPGTCSLAIHVALEWIGAPYEAVQLERSQLRSPEYLAINPMGVVPALIEDGRPLVEAGAILLHLTDSHADLPLGPPVGDPQRSEYYRWIAWLSGTVHPHFWPFFFPARYAEPESMHAAVRTAAEIRVQGDWDLLEARLDGRDWLMGDKPSLADGLLLPMARWGLRMSRPTTEWPRLTAHLQRVSAWAPGAAALAAQGLTPLP